MPKEGSLIRFLLADCCLEKELTAVVSVTIIDSIIRVSFQVGFVELTYQLEQCILFQSALAKNSSIHLL